MARRHEMYNAQLDYVSRQAELGNTFVIAPDAPLPIGRIEMKPAKMQLVYDMGRATCTRLLPSLLSFLKGNNLTET